MWREYTRLQATLGVPSLYYASRVYHLGEDGAIADDPLEPGVYVELRTLWAAYRARQRK